MDIPVTTVLLDSPDFGSMINVSRVYFFSERNVEIHCTIPKLSKIPKWKIVFQHLPYKMATLFFLMMFSRFRFVYSDALSRWSGFSSCPSIARIYYQQFTYWFGLLWKFLWSLLKKKAGHLHSIYPLLHPVPSNCFCYGSERVTLGCAQWWATAKWRNIFLPKKRANEQQGWDGSHQPVQFMFGQPNPP